MSWLFPSPADRLAKARRLLDAGRHADARLEALDVEHPDAAGLVAEAEQALAAQNLKVAVSWAEAGDFERVVLHMDLAEQFHHGGLEAEFRAARRRLREIRAEQGEAERRKQEQREARLMSVDPFGFGGGPSLLNAPIPDDIDEEDAVELTARLDLLIEGYPEDLRTSIPELGGDFARAVLDLDEGRADLALQGLLALPQDDPLVCWEMARAAYALGDAGAAARTLRRFPSLAGSHRPMGNQHSGVFLAQLLAESGDIPAGLRVLRDVRAAEPNAGGFLFANLLAATGELAQAEEVTRGLIKKNGRYLPFYALLARIRIAGGHRVEAMTALERAMDLTCGTPGRCGYMPPDLGIVRTLATLYLEDGLERDRALDLSKQARGMVQKPVWDDIYLAALAARAQGAADAPDLAERAWQLAPEGAKPRLEAHLALA